MSQIETTRHTADESSIEQKVPNPLATKEAVEQLIKTTRKLLKANGHKV